MSLCLRFLCAAFHKISLVPWPKQQAHPRVRAQAIMTKGSGDLGLFPCPRAKKELSSFDHFGLSFLLSYQACKRTLTLCTCSPAAHLQNWSVALHYHCQLPTSLCCHQRPPGLPVSLPSLLLTSNSFSAPCQEGTQSFPQTVSWRDSYNQAPHPSTPVLRAAMTFWFL